MARWQFPLAPRQQQPSVSKAVLMDAAHRLPEITSPLTNYGVVHEVARSGYEISASARASLKRKRQRPERIGPLRNVGGADGTRTRDPRRDRPVF
ncbi:hypothethical protein [Ralstonia solanacearum PSI07]|uniref:Hypothethical protein n=1 Tax=blood disease bacterium R229 TaxID=741978 RepID=G2ZLE8_9RALS|nr:hypothethical protein [Ralstonia solanacearum PSI07]CCA79879.1 hypothethical protein [blood disease bacterium R229]